MRSIIDGVSPHVNTIILCNNRANSIIVSVDQPDGYRSEFFMSFSMWRPP